jgi:5'-deoxynucleotidase YfbR-like HD superfamily hydrolase
VNALEFMWAGGYTKRYHTWNTLLTDTVGHHSFNVACILMFLRPQASAALLRAALLHDVAEHKVGDMPATAKRALPDYPGGLSFRAVFGRLEEEHMQDAGVELPVLTDEEAWALKLADVLDGMRFCLMERRMGNRSIAEVWVNFHAYAEEMLRAKASPAQKQDLDAFTFLEGEWADVC